MSAEVPKGALAPLGRAHFQADTFPAQLDIAPTGGSFVVAGEVGPVQVWSVPQAPQPPRLLGALPVSDAITTARFVDDETLFVALQRGSVSLWNWREPTRRVHHDFALRSGFSAISGDGRFLALGGAVFDRSTAAELAAAKPLATQSSLELSARGNRLVSTGLQEPWVIVRVLPSGETHSWRAPEAVHAAALSADGSSVAAATRDEKVYLFQANGKALRSWSGPSQVRRMHFIQGDARLVVVHDRGLSIYDVASGRELYAGRSDARITQIAFDGSLVAVGTDQGTLSVWDCERGALLCRTQFGRAAISAVDVHAKAQLLIAADETNELGTWRLP